MKITNGTKTYDVSNWDEEKVNKYLSNGWTKDGESKGSPRKDVKKAYKEMVEEIVSEEPTIEGEK